VKGAKRLGVRIGNWLTVDQSKTLLGGPPADHLRGKRDRAILALLIGCGLRRAELLGLGTQDLQVREERWVIADLIGKGKHIRTVPVFVVAKRAVDEWCRRRCGGSIEVVFAPFDLTAGTPTGYIADDGTGVDLAAAVVPLTPKGDGTWKATSRQRPLSPTSAAI